MNTDMNSPYFKSAQQLSLFIQGVEPGDFLAKEAMLQELLTSPTFNAEMCHALGAMYELAGKSASFESRLIETVTKHAAAGDWTAQAMQADIVETLYEVLGDDPEGTKEAAIAGGGALGQAAARLGLATAPGALKTLLATGVGLGTAGGALHWAMNRDAKTDDADIEAMKAQIAEYDRITEEISEKLRRKGLNPNDPAVQEKIKRLSGAQEVGVYA
jgi:hypothetical protein